MPAVLDNSKPLVAEQFLSAQATHNDISIWGVLLSFTIGKRFPVVPTRMGKGWRISC